MVVTVLWGVVVVTVAVVLALAGLVLARRVLPFPVREAHNANTATMFGALYVIYGLIVGFSAYQVADQFDAARRTAQNEAGSVGGSTCSPSSCRSGIDARYRGLPSRTPGLWWRTGGR